MGQKTKKVTAHLLPEVAWLLRLVGQEGLTEFEKGQEPQLFKLNAHEWSCNIDYLSESDGRLKTLHASRRMGRRSSVEEQGTFVDWARWSADFSHSDAGITSKSVTSRCIQPDRAMLLLIRVTEELLCCKMEGGEFSEECETFLRFDRLKRHPTG